MPSAHEQSTGYFRQWEMRGRGWRVFAEPVWPEPPFVPFYRSDLPDAPVVDDGRRPTFLNSFVQNLSRKVAASPPPLIPRSEPEPEPETLLRDSLVEFQISLPSDLNVAYDAFEQFLLNLSLCREPIAFELVGVHGAVRVQFVVGLEDASVVQKQLRAFFPEAVLERQERVLENAWHECDGDEIFVAEFGLEREFMFPLATGKNDPFVGIIGALSELQKGELGLYQILFQPVQNRWAENIAASVTHEDGKPFFVNAPELADAAKKKINRPLFAAIVRLMARTQTRDRLFQMASDLAGSLRVFAKPQGNALIPLRNDEYPSEAQHVEDVIARQTRRSGMLLNSEELIGFVHLPSSAVRSPVLHRDLGKTKSAPAVVQRMDGLLLGENIHAGKAIPIRLTAEDRVQHTHIIGASGTGKSTLLFNLIRQDIESGSGVGVLDPHGDLIDQILGIIPESRIDDVVLVDISDSEYPVGFNILSAHSDLEKTLLASDLVSVFRRFSSSWGDQMDTVFQNAVLAFLESSRGGTLADLRRFLIEPAFRSDFLKTVQDPELIYYWQKVFPQLTGNRSVGSVLTRLQDLLSQKPIRNMVSQPENKLDFSRIMDTGKIFLARLPEGLSGAANVHLLGALLVSKFQQTAMSRQAQEKSLRRDYWLYIDEFDQFITPSMAEILKGARKYRLGLTLAHQELHQLQADPKVASAVATHPLTRIVFRVDDDAKKLSESFAFFDAQSLKNLDKFHAIARVERSDFDFNLSVQRPGPIDEVHAAKRRQEVVRASRDKYGIPRAHIEAILREKLNLGPEPTKVQPTSPPLSTDSEKKRTKVNQESPLELAPPSVIKSLPTPPVPAPAPPAKTEPSKKERVAQEARAETGVGGNQHELIRKRISAIARELGFYPKSERPLPDGKRIDLALEKGDRIVIACEIAITTTVDDEVGNVAKCLKTECIHVAVICNDEAHAGAIQKRVAGCFPAEELKRVCYYLPDQFIAFLQAMKGQQSAPNQTEKLKLGKYKVKTTFLDTNDSKIRNDAVFEVLREVLRRKK
jgi:hypothetical protein